MPIDGGTYEITARAPGHVEWKSTVVVKGEADQQTVVVPLLEKQTPKEVVSKMAKVDRRGRVFVDWSQNHQKKTTIAVYSLRAREHPTASIPLHWREVERAAKSGKVDKLRFEIPDAIKRVEKEGDLFGPVLKTRQKLPDLGELETE